MDPNEFLMVTHGRDGATLVRVGEIRRISTKRGRNEYKTRGVIHLVDGNSVYCRESPEEIDALLDRFRI